MKRLFGFALVLAFMLSGIATVFAYEEIGPEEAYNMVEAIENAYILDVRTPSEWHWVGHPGQDKCGNGDFLDGKVINIPFELWAYDPNSKEYTEEPNRFFDEEVVRQFDPEDTIILMCRSGSRSSSASGELEDPTHPACKRLEELGFYNIYNMVEGFEGGKDECGYRTLDAGWKNKGLPYNYSDNGIW
ncbi:MAG: hypothetical protein IMF19_07080, partial [Proteobacteria bacterium]|nr:hypothetical protein [Pseudomonadota bacterium]